MVAVNVVAPNQQLVFSAIAPRSAPPISAFPQPPILPCLFRVPDFFVHRGAEPFGDYPQQLSSSSGQVEAVTYRQQAGYYALRYDDAEAQPPGALLVLRDERGAIALFEGEPAVPGPRSQLGEAADLAALPVYGAPGLMAVPTGEIFVRFGDGIDARDRAADLAQVGYRIDRLLDFAPQGAWVMAESGQISDSLQGLESLAALPDVENVEPQMLMERSTR
jgi:hypothetical protein